MTSYCKFAISLSFLGWVLSFASPVNGCPGSTRELHPKKVVIFNGKRINCQTLWEFSEDEEFAKQFQSLRKRAASLRASISKLKEALDSNIHWLAINQALSNTTYAVEAFDTVVSLITAKSIVKELVKNTFPGPVGIVAKKLRKYAAKTDEIAKQQRQDILASISIAEATAVYWEKESNNVIQLLIEAKRILSNDCQIRK
jgi:hypothetical protein